MNNKLLEKAQLIASTIKYANVASITKEGHPWNTPLSIVIDDELNLYWRSWVKSQHSVNFHDNNNAFITIYDSTKKSGMNHQECLYMKAEVFEIDTEDEVINLLSRFQNVQSNSSEFLNNGIKRIYKAKPIKIWLNNKSVREVDEDTIAMRIEVPL